MRKIEVTYLNEGKETAEWQAKFVSLLSKAICNYLKTMENPQRNEQEPRILEQPQD